MTERPVEIAGEPTLSFRQLDRLNGVPKGTSFRCFKRVRERLREGRDYFILDAVRDAELIAALRARGDAYPTPAHVVLLTQTAYHLMSSGYSPRE
jgi:hypothetical protein